MSTDVTRSPIVEKLLDDWNVPYEFVDDFALDKLQTKDYSQVREAKHRAPKENVEQYALQMVNGAPFPPIVVAANDGSLIDGNTRVGAARHNSYSTFPAYVVKPADPAMARIIGSTLNQAGGVRLTPEELQDVAKAFLERRFSDAEIARCLGRTAEWARKFRKRAEFDHRAASHAAVEKLKPTVKERLADIPQDAALNIILDAAAEGLKLDVGSTAKLVDAAKETHSDRDAVAVVTDGLAAIRAVNQAPEVSETRDGSAAMLRSAVRQCLKHIESDQKLAAALRTLNVPLVEPAATEYRETLARLQASTDDLRAAVLELSGRLPASDAA